jgi:excisionase family DNA binding protein
MSTVATSKRLLLPEETWKRLRISRASFYRLVSRGEIPAVRVGGQLRIPEEELEAWLYEEPEA